MSYHVGRLLPQPSEEYLFYFFSFLALSIRVLSLTDKARKEKEAGLQFVVSGLVTTSRLPVIGHNMRVVTGWLLEQSERSDWLIDSPEVAENNYSSLSCLDNLRKWYDIRERGRLFVSSCHICRTMVCWSLLRSRNFAIMATWRMTSPL